MRILFMGTPAFAVPSLAKLIDAGHRIVGVFTQPDRPVGRFHAVIPSPVRRLATEHSLPVYAPESIRSDDVRRIIPALNPDTIVVTAYGKILPPWMIEAPPYGAINVHASLLPQYRGAAPIQWAVANGESRTGVSTMKMDAGLDTGDVLLQREVNITPEDTAETLHDKLSILGANLLVDTLGRLGEGSLFPRKQDHSLATFAPILRKGDGELDWGWPSQRIHNRVRGFNPWPGTFTLFRGKLLRVWKTSLEEDQPQAKNTEFPTGALFHVAHMPLRVQTGDGKRLLLLEVQPEGHRRISGRDFWNGFRIKPGERLGKV